MVTASSVIPNRNSAVSGGTSLGNPAASSSAYDRRGQPTDRSEVPDPLTGRREFLNYCLSLMRAHNNEHSDTLPVIDVASMKHIAYVFDCLIYYMRSGQEVNPFGENVNVDDSNADILNDQVGFVIVMTIQKLFYHFFRLSRMKMKTMT